MKRWQLCEPFMINSHHFWECKLLLDKDLIQIKKKLRFFVFCAQKRQYFCQKWKYRKNMQAEHNLNGLYPNFLYRNNTVEFTQLTYLLVFCLLFYKIYSRWYIRNYSIFRILLTALKKYTNRWTPNSSRILLPLSST